MKTMNLYQEQLFWLKKVKKELPPILMESSQLNLQKGTTQFKFLLLVTKPVSKVVSLTKDDVIDFALLPDSTVLEEVLVSAVRVKAEFPVTHSNLSKKEIAKRNLGQDIPILLNYLPSVVSSQMLEQELDTLT